MNSRGLGTLVGLYTSARFAGGEIKLAGLTQCVKKVLQVAKLGLIFEFYDTEERKAKRRGSFLGVKRGTDPALLSIATVFSVRTTGLESPSRVKQSQKEPHDEIYLRWKAHGHCPGLRVRGYGAGRYQRGKTGKTE